MTYNRINSLLGFACGLIATCVYIATVEKTVSWWDCGEFIACAYKLEVAHQPGAPLFLLIQNVFSNLALGNAGKIAYWMNIGSAICSGLTVTFLFWTITAIAKKILCEDKYAPLSNCLQIFGAGIVGAMAFSFSDSFWYSAVESEVYAMSSLCTAVVFWGILKWEARADEEGSDRWLVFIGFVMGAFYWSPFIESFGYPSDSDGGLFQKSNSGECERYLKSVCSRRTDPWSRFVGHYSMVGWPGC